MKGKVLPLSKRNLIKIKVNGVEKRYKPSRHYVFILQVRWSDMSEYVIYRKYSDFYTLQCGLVDKFPIEAGAIRESDRTLPYLPGRLLFSRTEVSKVAFQRKSDLAKYCSSLLELDPKISQCAEVINFFEATFEDINPPKDATKKPDHSKLILALLPFLKKKSKDEDYSVDDMTITGPITLETYAVIADYKAGDKSEVSLKEGDHLEVFEKNNNGWWFVQSESGQGWAPASYLEPVSHPIEIDEPDPTYKGNLEKFITTESYTAQFSDEISFDQDVILEVMHKLLDGWWIVSYQGDAGYAPAAYLEPYNNPHFLRSSTVKRPTIKPIPRRCTIKSKSKAWKKKTEKDLTLYRQYSRKRKSTQKAPVVSVPPKPPRIIEEEEEAATSLYINTQAKKAITQAIEEEPSYLEVEENADAIYENITETKETESELPAPVPPPRPGNESVTPPTRSSSITSNSDCHSLPDLDAPICLNQETSDMVYRITTLNVVAAGDQPRYNKAPPPPYIPELIITSNPPTGDSGSADLDPSSNPSTPSSGYGSRHSTVSTESQDLPEVQVQVQEPLVSVTKL